MKRPRFTLRALFILTGLLAAFCYWRDRPRQVANRFIALIEAGDYQAAEAMFGGKRVGISNVPAGMSDVKASRKRQSAADWLWGQCYVNFTGTVGNDDYLLPSIATATGMQAGNWRLRDALADVNIYSPLPHRSR